MSDRWLEPALERNLARVTAPEQLWDRVRLPRQQLQKRPGLRLAWALAAAGLVLAVVGLRGNRSQLEFRSADAAQIQAWVKAHSGVDLELPARPSASVHLLGVHIVPGAGRAVEVSYRAGRYEARLLISKDSSVANRAAHGVANPDWVMKGQRYLLSCADPAGLQAACLLCHPGGGRDVTFN